MEKGEIYDKLDICNKNGKVYLIKKENAKLILSKTKLIYKTNVLSSEDYQRNRNTGKYNHFGKLDYFYDCSIGGILMNDIKTDTNLEMRTRVDTDNFLESYFTYEQYKQIKFVFDKNQFKILEDMKKKKNPVPVPEKLYINLLINNGLHIELKDFYNHNWNTQLEKFLFSCERIWDNHVNSSQILPLALARAAVLNALKSFLRFIYSGRVKPKLFNRLKM